ncbi:MAG: hypothetical protein ACUVUG_00835 [Candidatus Aminicenantia bacterium]
MPLEKFYKEEAIGKDKKFERGVGLIYVIILIAIILIAVGILGPYLFVRETSRKQSVETLERIKAIRIAIIGNQEIISKNLRSSFGYVGDMGGLPPILEYLVLKQNPTPNPFPVSWNQTAWSFHTTGIGYGWRGPYIDPTYTGNWEFQAFRDAWGTKLQYIDNAGNTLLNPASISFPVYIRSAGEDRTFGTSDDINESNHPELCRINRDDVIAVLRGYTYCQDGTPIQRNNINVYWPSLVLNGTVTINQGVYTSSTSGNCPYDQVPPPTCYYFETPTIPVGIRKVIFDPSAPYIDQFVVINGGGKLHDGSVARMRWNFRGGSCGGCIEVLLPRNDYRDLNGLCSGTSRDVFSVRIRNRCSYPVSISSIRVDYPYNIYFLNAYITINLRRFDGIGWGYGCGGAPPPGGSSGITYSFNTTAGVVFLLGTGIRIYPSSCNFPASATIPAGGVRYLTVGRFIRSDGSCADIRNLTFRITLSDGSVLNVPPP